MTLGRAECVRPLRGFVFSSLFFLPSSFETHVLFSFGMALISFLSMVGGS